MINDVEKKIGFTCSCALVFPKQTTQNDVSDINRKNCFISVIHVYTNAKVCVQYMHPYSRIFF